MEKIPARDFKPQIESLLENVSSSKKAPLEEETSILNVTSEEKRLSEYLQELEKLSENFSLNNKKFGKKIEDLKQKIKLYEAILDKLDKLI